jgi:L-fuculose-phosphate aldolase
MNEAQIKGEIVEIVRELWARGHMDTTGVAVSVRTDENRVLVDPSGTGYRRGNVSEEEIITIDLDCNLIENGSVSRKLAPANTIIHTNFFKGNQYAQACVHCHAAYSLVFACLGKSINPFTLQSQIVGEVPCVMIDDVKVKENYHSKGFSEVVPSGLIGRPEVFHVMKIASQTALAIMQPRLDEMKGHGLAFTLHRHGIFVFGRNLGEAFDNLERVERNAKVILLSKNLI